VVGTPAYVAPERLTDPLSIDIRSDVYSLGALGFNLLTTKDVFEGNSAMEICYHTMKTPAPRPSEKTARPIPPRLEQLVLDCLAKDPGGRPGDMRTIITALDAIAEETGPWQQQAAQAWWRLNAERIRAFQERTRPAADTAARDKRPLEVALDGSTSEE
jgi:serine/threonine-protein kinase